MVKEGMWKHGGKITENIRHIKKPKRKNVKENKTTIIYKDDGTPVKREDIRGTQLISGHQQHLREYLGIADQCEIQGPTPMKKN